MPLTSRPRQAGKFLAPRSLPGLPLKFRVVSITSADRLMPSSQNWQTCTSEPSSDIKWHTDVAGLPESSEAGQRLTSKTWTRDVASFLSVSRR